MTQFSAHHPQEEEGEAEGEGFQEVAKVIKANVKAVKLFIRFVRKFS